MIKTVPQLTLHGESLLIRAVAGEQITFTRFKAGDAVKQDQTIYDGTGFEELDDIIDAKLSFDITEIDTSEAGVAAIGGAFATADITSEFAWRELGVFAKGEDNVEVLYAYAYDAEPSTIAAYSEDLAIYQKITFAVAIGEAESVTATINENLPQTGYYKGNGANKRTIALGFKPHAVMVTDEYGRTQAADGVYGGVATRAHAVRGAGSSAADGTSWNTGGTALKITENGFIVSYVSSETAANSIMTNVADLYYNYIAIS